MKTSRHLFNSNFMRARLWLAGPLGCLWLVVVQTAAVGVHRNDNHRAEEVSGRELPSIPWTQPEIPRGLSLERLHDQPIAGRKRRPVFPGSRFHVVDDGDELPFASPSLPSIPAQDPSAELDLGFFVPFPSPVTQWAIRDATPTRPRHPALPESIRAVHLPAIKETTRLPQITLGASLGRIPAMPRPAQWFPTDALMLDHDADFSPEHLKAMLELFGTEAGWIPPASTVHGILRRATAVFRKNHRVLVDIHVPENARLTIVGDLHGQLGELKLILGAGGPSPSHYLLFNGDIVDRGDHSLETLLVILGSKLLFPEFVFVTRGNHEDLNINSRDGFMSELSLKYRGSGLTWQDFEEVIEHLYAVLPIAHVVQGKIFVVHGGIPSDERVSLNQIRRLDNDLNRDFIVNDLTWSDPGENPGIIANKDRRTAHIFGPDVTKRFCAANRLDGVVRSHQMVPEGYEIMHDNRLVTVFSAARYHRMHDNKGAVLQFIPQGSGYRLEVQQFDSAIPSNPVQRWNDQVLNWPQMVRDDSDDESEMSEADEQDVAHFLAHWSRLDGDGNLYLDAGELSDDAQAALVDDLAHEAHLEHLAGHQLPEHVHGRPWRRK